MKDQELLSSSQLAERVAQAMRTMDVAALEPLYAPDIIVKLNFSADPQGKAQNLAVLEEFFGRCKSVSYINIDRHLTEAGYVQQHDLQVELKNGRQACIPFCQVVRVRNGRIWRLDEYLDPAPFFALMAEADGAAASR